LDLAGLPAPAAGTVRGSVFAGLAVADKLGSQALGLSVRGAFVRGMDPALLTSVGFALAGGILALAFLPAHSARREPDAIAEAPTDRGLTASE